jgi:hypothetical protein
MYETVDHPPHYNQHPAGIECIDVVEEMGFNIGNAIKYLWRAGLKPGTDNTEDLKKAAWYIDREEFRLEVRGNVPVQDLQEIPGLEDVVDVPSPSVQQLQTHSTE